MTSPNEIDKFKKFDKQEASIIIINGIPIHTSVLPSGGNISHLEAHLSHVDDSKKFYVINAKNLVLSKAQFDALANAPGPSDDVIKRVNGELP